MSESIVSQERRTQALAGESNPIKPWSVEQDADALMDDLFADFDRLLEGGAQLPGETVRPEPSPMPAIAMPAIAPLSPLPAPLSTESGETLSVPQPESEIALPQPASPTAAPQKPRSSTQHWDKLLLAFAIAALLGSLAWLALQEKLKIQQWVEQWAVKVRGEPSASTEVASLSESDAQFANYMLRSLDLIERKAARAPQTASSSGQSALPPAPGTSPAIPQVVNNYNIYQSAPGLANGLLPAPSPAAPANNSQPSAEKAPAPPARAEARSTAPATSPTSSQAAAPPARTLVPALPTSPESQPAPSTETSSSPTSETVPTPLEKYSLVGLIVGSDGNSAALFKVNGTTQRIRAGEAIGDSGWTLYSAGNQSAVVRRNGRVREIYVGQEF